MSTAGRERLREPRTEAGKRLLAREAYNARSFALITVEDVIAIEDEVREELRGLVRYTAGIEHGPCIDAGALDG